MPNPDETDPDDAWSGPPLPPDDRLWRHPSELPPTPAASPQPPAGRGVLGIAVASATIGAVALLGVLIATGALDRDTTAGPRSETVATTAPNDTPAVDQAVVSVVQLRVTRGDATTSGAGVVIRSDGHVLTSSDLVSQSTRITARLADGRSVEAEVVGTDPRYDLAVVKLAARGLQPIALGRAADLHQGDVVFAVTVSPGESGPPVTSRGSVVALGLLIAIDGEASLHDMIQASGEVGPLSPGSALLDRSGALVALTTGRRGTGQNTDEGPVATPIEFARQVSDEIVATGKAHHPWLGIEARDAAGTHHGAEVTEVSADSPADDAGLKIGDVIDALDGDQIGSVDDLVIALRTREPSEAITVQYWRNDERRRCTPRLGEAA